MRRLLAVLGILAVLLGGIGWLLLRAPAIETKPILRKNPTSYVFHAGVQETHEAVKKAFRNREWREMALQDDKETFALVGSSFAWDWVLTRFHDPIGKSATYSARGEPLDYLAEFHLHVVERGPKETWVDVWTLSPEVINGKSFGFGSCGPGFANRYVPVQATTIEEYEILLKIGAALGEKGMPALVLPTGN